MNVIRFAEARTCEPDPGWVRVSTCSEEAISIEHFTKPPHHASPVHQHANAQVLVVLSGKMTVIEGDHSVVLGEGDTVYLEPDVPHAVSNDGDDPAVGLDIFLPGRSFDFWLNRMKKK